MVALSPNDFFTFSACSWFTSVSAMTSAPVSAFVMRRVWSAPIAPVPITPILSVMLLSFIIILIARVVYNGWLFPILVDVALDLIAHKTRRLLRSFIPCKDAAGQHAIKANFMQGFKEGIPINFTFSYV